MKVKKGDPGFGWYITYTACGRRELSAIRDETRGYLHNYLNVEGIFTSSFKARRAGYTPIIFGNHYNKAALKIKLVCWRFKYDFAEGPGRLERTLCAKLKESFNE